MPKTEVDGVQEYDVLMSKFLVFEFRDRMEEIQIPAGVRNRPDILAVKLWGNSRWWWIITELNAIDDIWTDFYTGRTIKIPSKADVERFFRENYQYGSE